MRELGAGGSGKVMLTKHRSTNETYAMKVIQLNDLGEASLEQIEREVTLQTRCRTCPNIVRFKE